MIQMVRSQLRAFFWIFIFTALSVSFAPLTLGQERIEQAISEPKADVTDFYQRQKMDEEIRSLRGELDLVKRRLVDLEKVQQLVRDLMQKVSRIEAQIRIGDGSSSLASVTDGLKIDLDLVASKVDSLDVDIRKSLEALAGDLSGEPVSLIQPERSAVRKATSSENPPALADEKKDVKSFYSYAKNAYDNKRYDEAIELFGLLNNAFPENQYSQSGMYWTAMALKDGDYRSEEALSILKSLLPRLQKTHNKRCEVALEAALISLERKQCKVAKKFLTDASVDYCNKKLHSSKWLKVQTRLQEVNRRCD